VAEPLAALEVALLDGEVLWGTSLSDKFDDLRKAAHELGLNVHYYLEGVADTEIMRARGTEQIKKIGEIAIARGTRDAPDPFQARIDEIICEIEKLVRPKVP
jgi:hypothetical protein